MTSGTGAAGHQREMNRLYCESNELYHNLAASYGLSDSVLWILYTLSDEKRPLTPKEIGEMCSLSKQTVHSSLQSLGRDGYVTISASPENKKSKLVELTGKGMGLAEETVAHIMDAEIRAYSRMEEEERRGLLRLLGKYQMLLKEETGSLIKK